MKTYIRVTLTFFLLIGIQKNYSQHFTKMQAVVNPESKTITVEQEFVYHNASNDTLTSLVFNDWNNAYATKFTPLAKRFSDEFYRGFHLAKEDDRGSTQNLKILDTTTELQWNRPEKNPDCVVVTLTNAILPFQKIKLTLTYTLKIPNAKFTNYGIDNEGNFSLKNCFLVPARYENNKFLQYSNNNLDDSANGITSFEVLITLPSKKKLSTDLNVLQFDEKGEETTHLLKGDNRTNINLIITSKPEFTSFKNNIVDVVTDLKNTKLNDVQKALVIDKVVTFTNAFIGKYPHEKIIITQNDYDKNPFYGLNQLPSFLSPFPEEFLYEIKFLKTYLNSFLKTSLHLDPRKENWIYDGIQVYAMMKYIDENYPNTKMIGSLSRFKLLQNFNIANIDFNDQYSYFYMLMARKNLDQPLGESKNNLIKFNEQIANKYKAGLSIRFLDDFLKQDIMMQSIQELYAKKQHILATRTDFETLLKSKTKKDISWFFTTMINSRDIVDYKFTTLSKTKDSITFSVKNRTGTTIPIPVYGTRKGATVFKQWLDIEACDSTLTIPRKNIDRLILNLKNEVPEFNLRNNWKKLNGFLPNNRPIKFVFMKDLEDPYYNQILYVPSIYYNLYDGLTPGIRLHNKTILDKPIIFDVNPSYSTRSQNISGSAAFVVNQNIRTSTLYNIRYGISANYFNYAQDAAYFRLNPSIQLRIREPNFRDNRKQLILFRQVIVNKDESAILTENTATNYSVFNTRYINTKTEVTNHVNFAIDLQASGKFSKLTAEIEYRKLFENNRQLNLRFYAGSFLHNKTQSNFFSFALDRPTDYLFDYNYIGRSENSGLFSQQYIIAEGGFKSKIDTPFANRWLTSLNASYSIWNWIELYGDVGLMKNSGSKERFVYDSGIRLNLVTDYFELYFPVYSNNGWEISQNKYNEKIRFIVTFSPKTLLNLFNRKWF
ncbi:gluzincin family metallopeptidase [Flavobacterium tiangeerense]|uniref:aminopeptidase n=1 Tax=Flavobacterium tiangeerense TaxID=459471 RepID=UPI00293924ED|nr:aminopeptidase [Flavobacterium tiangeerense]